jgi:type II secretory pathway component PulF
MGERIPVAALARTFDQFAVLLNTGMPISEAFRRAAGVSDPELVSISKAVEGPLMTGVPLSHALLPWRDRLPEIVLPILEVGALSGTLDGSSRRLGGAFGQSAALERHYRFAIFNPWVVIVCYSLYTNLVVFTSSLAQGASAVCSTALHLTAMYIIGLLLLRLICKWEPLRYLLDSIKLAIPGMGMIARNLAAARWGRSFATLWSCGVPVSTALEVSSRSALNAKYERAFKQAALRTRYGEQLADCLTSTELLPKNLVEMVRVGEISGSLGISIEQFAAELESEALTQASQQLAFLVTAVQIILIVLAVANLAH